VADGERMNPQEGWRVLANAGDHEHQGDEHIRAHTRALIESRASDCESDFSCSLGMLPPSQMPRGGDGGGKLHPANVG
jgi:hypothetical protein